MTEVVAERLKAFLKQELEALNPTPEQLAAAIGRMKQLIKKINNEEGAA